MCLIICFKDTFFLQFHHMFFYNHVDIDPVVIQNLFHVQFQLCLKYHFLQE